MSTNRFQKLAFSVNSTLSYGSVAFPNLSTLKCFQKLAFSLFFCGRDMKTRRNFCGFKGKHIRVNGALKQLRCSSVFERTGRWSLTKTNHRVREIRSKICRFEIGLFSFYPSHSRNFRLSVRPKSCPRPSLPSHVQEIYEGGEGGWLAFELTDNESPGCPLWSPFWRSEWIYDSCAHLLIKHRFPSRPVEFSMPPWNVGRSFASESQIWFVGMSGTRWQGLGDRS